MQIWSFFFIMKINLALFRNVLRHTVLKPEENKKLIFFFFFFVVDHLGETTATEHVKLRRNINDLPTI